MSTHYVGFFTKSRGRGQYLEQKAVCGAWASLMEHATEPSCALCQSWLEQDAINHAQTMEAWEEEDANISEQVKAIRQREQAEWEQKYGH